MCCGDSLDDTHSMVLCENGSEVAIFWHWGVLR